MSFHETNADTQETRQRGSIGGARLSSLGLLLLVGSAAARAEEFQIRSDRISLSYDEMMQRRIAWLAPGARNILAFDPAAQEGIEAFGVEYSLFRLDASRTSQKRVDDVAFGPAVEATVTGVFDGATSGVRIERRVRVLLPERYPDAALFESTYTNLGDRPLRLDRVCSQRVLLDRKMADPQEPSYAFASFQGGAYRWGNDYALIWLKPGFKQSNFQGAEEVSGAEGVGGGIKSSFDKLLKQ